LIRLQHAAGRKLTESILKGTFPVFTEAELDKLGDKFEEQEQKLLGSGGFEGSLKEVGDLEKTLGIHDLATFTPR